MSPGLPERIFFQIFLHHDRAWLADQSAAEQPGNSAGVSAWVGA
jgi:hypothetical protein